ncbi:MAG TPA: hypothetical protein VGE36_20905 [Roseateles sp.]
MMFLAVWAIVATLLVCWSGFVWAAQALLDVMLTQAGKLGTGDWSLPEPLAAWLPTVAAEWLAGTLETWAPQLQALIGWLPSLSGGVTVLAWVAWLLGALPLLVVGIACHVAVAAYLRSRRPVGAVAVG